MFQVSDVYLMVCLKWHTSQKWFCPQISFTDTRTCCHGTPLYLVCITNWHYLQGCFRLCDWLSLWCLVPWINKLRPRWNEQHFTDDIFKRIFFNENVWISIKISLKFVPKGPINSIPSLVQIMAWRCSGDKPLSEPMMVNSPTHICVTRPQWVNHLPLYLGPLFGKTILSSSINLIHVYGEILLVMYFYVFCS